MTNIRLLPVVILAVAALLVLKTVGLMTNGGYVLTGVGMAQAADGGPSEGQGGETITLPSLPTIEDATPTLGDDRPTVGAASSGDETAPSSEDGGEAPAVPVASNSIAAGNECDPRPVLDQGEVPNPDGDLMVIAADCPPPADALPLRMTADGSTPLSAGNTTLTEQALLERLASRRTDLDSYEQELAMRAALVEAAEQRIEERQQTLQTIENQIASLVEQRKEMEAGQFAGIVAMYETMKPKDAAKIFNALDIEVLVRVAKTMSPRKMSPILAEMSTARAQELTVRLASASEEPAETMTAANLAELPQIVGQ